jgi:hypothetical protein
MRLQLRCLSLKVDGVDDNMEGLYKAILYQIKLTKSYELEFT